MSFLDYLKENRGQFIDHRVTPPARPGVAALEAEAASDNSTNSTVSGGGGRVIRRRRPRTAPRSVRFQLVRPAFSPSPYSDPLPYEEPWERAFR